MCARFHRAFFIIIASEYRCFCSTALNELRDSLELLDLSSNCLSAVPATTLRGHNKMMYLDLSDNKIDDLPNMQFMNMPALTEVSTFLSILKKEFNF
jgi:hypothetical protein